MNSNPGKVIATKGAKVVNSITSSEKGETMSIIACCNAVGNYVPPALQPLGRSFFKPFKIYFASETKN